MRKPAPSVLIVGMKNRIRINRALISTPLAAAPLVATSILAGSVIAAPTAFGATAAATPFSSATPFGSDASLSAPQLPAGSTFPSSGALKTGGQEQTHYNGAFDLSQASKDPNVGGLSGLTALADGSYLAISDDKGDHGPTRAYRLNIDNNGRAKVTGQVNFTKPDGSAYNPKEYDAEEIQQLPNGHLLWTTEGESKGSKNRSPLVIESDSNGREIRRIHPPHYHVPDHNAAKDIEQTKGISPNKGPEGMTISPDGETFYTLNENSLVQDGPINTPEAGSKTRLTAYSTATGRPKAEYVVEVDPTYTPKADRGYASLATSPDGSLYALQRGYIPKQGNRAEIYRLSLEGATNVLGRERLDGSEVPVNREKVFDFAGQKPSDIHKLGDNQSSSGDKANTEASPNISASPENVEGLTFAAPPAHSADVPAHGSVTTGSLPAGSSAIGNHAGSSTSPAKLNRVYLISDNNFSDSQRTLLHSLDIPQR